MQAEERLQAGDSAGALEALQDVIRKKPDEARLRIFLFQLLAVRGDWKRAVTQLKVSAELDAEATAMAKTYREGIICEVFREKVFAGEKEPLIFGEPGDWIALLVEALKLFAQDKVEEAATLRARAFDAAPAASGEINGERFDWIADADMRLGPVLEVVVNGKYFWMPFTAIDSLIVEPPADLRDTVWTPAEIKLATGGDIVGLIPTRYAGTTDGGTEAELLARVTHWSDAGAETFVGKGQRLLATDKGDTAIMDLRTLKIDQASSETGQVDG